MQVAEPRGSKCRPRWGIGGGNCNLVGMLDGLNRYRFRNDAELMAEWESVSRVRPFHRNGEEPATASGVSCRQSGARWPRPREGPATGALPVPQGAVGRQGDRGSAQGAPGRAFMVPAPALPRAGILALAAGTAPQLEGAARNPLLRSGARRLAGMLHQPAGYTESLRWCAQEVSCRQIVLLKPVLN